MTMKKNINELAIFGGPMAFKNKLYVGRPNIGKKKILLKRINNILDSHWLTNDGPYVQEFEKRIAEYIGVKHCIPVCNATIGLEITIRALGLTGEVIVPSMTFIATAHSLEWLNVKPVFCDIENDTWNIDPAKIEKLITPKTSAIIGVHLFGRPCNVEALESIASKYNLKLIFDSAHAFGCSYDKKMIGNFGSAEVFSFHATKFFNSLEGGAITTNDDELARKIRLMRNFGFHNYEILSVGTNGKMNEFSAAMGITSFDSINDFIEKNSNNYKLYQRELAGIPGLELIRYNEDEKCNFQYLVLNINAEETKINRDIIMNILWAENVIARNYFFPGCHKAEPYITKSGRKKNNLIVTDKLSNNFLSLPTGNGVNKSEIIKLCALLRFCFINAKEISSKLSEISKNNKYE